MIPYMVNWCFAVAKSFVLGPSGIDVDWHRCPTGEAFAEEGNLRKWTLNLRFLQ
jgi:hypothetical protein